MINTPPCNKGVKDCRTVLTKHSALDSPQVTTIKDLDLLSGSPSIADVVSNQKE